MSQDCSFDMPDCESIEIVQNYLKQINSENIANDESKNIMNNILAYVSENNNTIDNSTEYIVDSKSESTSDNSDDNEINSLSMDEVEGLREKFELQTKLENKLNEAIQKEKELLKITQEKLLSEVKLLETIKQRLCEEEKLKLLLNTSENSNEFNFKDLKTEQTNFNIENTINNDIQTQTKVTKLNTTLLKLYKR
jgi:hypothetical protein